MTESHSVDITELAVVGEQFPLRLMQLGFRLMQVIDKTGDDQYRYVIPPVCEVPAGPFLMGSDEQHDPEARENEFPQHVVTLGAYSICTYLLTVAEYAYFVQATNHREPRHSYVSWQQQLAERLDHPVVNAAWNDVLAYVQWLVHVTGEAWHLPTEAEWEKAARGTDGRIYPWGDQWDNTRANSYHEKSPYHTTPVGSYPSGASPYGAQDMAGNVIEWTNTAFRNYPYRADDGREDLNAAPGKVLRSGSWINGPQYARAACRSFDVPAKTDRSFGARLARESVAG